MDYKDKYEEYINDFIDDLDDMYLINECDNYMMSEPETASRPKPLPRNKMTLRTKTNPRTKLKYLKVALEDLGPYLERSSCFCKDCKTLFATRNALNSHNMTAHSSQVDKDSPKKTNAPPQNYKYCNHCHKYFDYSLLIQHLYDLIKAKRKAMKKAQNSITPKASLAINTQVTEVEKRTRLPTVEPDCVPKDILFKCDKCPLHFLNGMAGVNHVSQQLHRTDNIIVKSSWICPQCNRLFRRRDRNMHKLQHQFTSIFKVYDVLQDLYWRVLYKCVECKVYFDEKFFVMHIRRKYCYGSSKAKQCAVCEIKIHNLEEHNPNHDLRQLIKSDFILIDDYVSLPDRYNLNSKLRAKPKPGAKFQRTTNGKKMTLYYCDFCKIYMTNLNLKSFHSSKKCGTYTRKTHCRVCGLMFDFGRSLHFHMTFHNSLNMELKDFFFCSISSLKPIAPPIPVFPTCAKCNIHYLASHTCGESRKICDICKDAFNLTSFKIHVLHHKYLGNGVHINKAKSRVTAKKIVFQYEKLKSTWNILYNCNQCGATSDMYDKVVEHCQKHFNNLSHNTLMICDICSLYFEEDCYKRHRELHLLRKIDKNSFNISNYDYFNLFNPLLNGFLNS